MSRFSEIIKSLHMSSPKRKFKRKVKAKRQTKEWKDGWDVFIEAPVAKGYGIKERGGLTKQGQQRSASGTAIAPGSSAGAASAVSAATATSTSSSGG